METRESKEARLAALKAELLCVEGTTTEVYSRIVGYYRSVKNWNAGKRAEFGKRREYAFPSVAQSAVEPAARPVQPADALLGSTRSGAPSSYMLFTRAACPNCPPVRDYLRSSGLPGVVVDVDTEEGLELARRYEVMSTPTAILMGPGGEQLGRAHARSQLERLVKPELELEVATA